MRFVRSVVTSARLAALVVLACASGARPAGEDDATPAAAEETPGIDAELAELDSPDMQRRIAGLRALMTSLDPRIPEALLPLLEDEGNSIRRLAARSIGSRWWQIPEDRVAAFVQALGKNAASELAGEARMAKRSIGLLKRDYGGPMLPRSSNRRWVVYERRGLPCLIDTRDGSEELLGWSPESRAWLLCALGNEDLDSCVDWHPRREAVAMGMLLHRKASTVWIWRHPRGLAKISIDDFTKLLDPADRKIIMPAGFFVDGVGWNNGRYEMELSCQVDEGNRYFPLVARFAWDLPTATLQLVSSTRGEGE